MDLGGPAVNAVNARNGPQTGPPPQRTTPPADPPVVILAGDSGMGKSVDCGYSFPTFHHLAAPGALEPYRATVGWNPDAAGSRTEAKLLSDVIRLIPQIAEKGYGGVVVDDATFVMAYSLGIYDKSADAISKKPPYNHNGFYAPMAIRADLVTLRETARFCRIPVIFNTWLRAPTTSDGVFTPGGPDVPAKFLIRVMPPMADLVLRSAKNPTRKPWPGVYICDEQDPNYITKNRLEPLPRESPMNIAEILRYSGQVVPRHPGLPWQEEAVSVIAMELWQAGVTEDARIGGGWFDLLLRKYSAKHVRWTLRDAMDRVTLWRTVPGASDMKTSFGW